MESGLIVGSILLALFLDAAWDYRTDRVQEAEYIEGLREEFQANQRELSVDAARRDEMATLTARALLATETGGPALEADSARLVIGALLDYRFYSPSEAVLNDLISSGSLSILRSAELRRALMQYLQECERLRVAEERERDFAAGALEPYLVDHLTLSQAQAAASGFGPRSTSRAPGPVARLVVPLAGRASTEPQRNGEPILAGGDGAGRAGIGGAGRMTRRRPDPPHGVRPSGGRSADDESAGAPDRQPLWATLWFSSSSSAWAASMATR